MINWALMTLKCAFCQKEYAYCRLPPKARMVCQVAQLVAPKGQRRSNHWQPTSPPYCCPKMSQLSFHQLSKWCRVSSVWLIYKSQHKLEVLLFFPLPPQSYSSLFAFIFLFFSPLLPPSLPPTSFTPPLLPSLSTLPSTFPTLPSTFPSPLSSSLPSSFPSSLYSYTLPLSFICPLSFSLPPSPFVLLPPSSLS